MKKLLCILLAVVLCFGVLPISAFAEGENIVVSATPSKTSVNVGETFTVDFKLTKNTGFVTLGLQVEYDSDVLEIVCPNHKAGSENCTGVVTNKLGAQGGVGNSAVDSQYHTDNPYVIQWAYGTLKNDVTYTGRIATLTFKAKKAVAGCTTAIKVNVDQASNYANGKISFVGGSTNVAVHNVTTASTTVKKATTSANGSITRKCATCGKEISTTTIYYPKTVTLSATSYTYDGKVKTPAVTVKGSDGKVISSGNYSVAYASGRTNVGTYKVTVTFKNNYSGSKALSFKINAVSSAKCSVKLGATSYTYDGKVKTPAVTVKGSDGKVISSGNYSVAYASGRTNVGTYKVTVTFKNNYSGSKALSFKINAVSSAKCSVKLGATSYTYDGKVKTPTVTVKNAAGKVLKKNTDYTVTYATGRKNVGTYKVTVKFKGNYTGTKTLSFKIKPIDVSKCKISLSKTSYTYNGKAQKPSVTVKNASGTKLTTSSYTVTYAKGLKNVGIYKVTIKMKGNYTGTKTLTYKINPVKTTVSKLTAGKKKLTVNITKKSTQVTGYQIQYSTSKKFTSAKTKTIKTTKATVSSLKAKTTYYVRVRTYKTVGKTKYYSSWSTYKKVTTKK